MRRHLNEHDRRIVSPNFESRGKIQNTDGRRLPIYAARNFSQMKVNHKKIWIYCGIAVAVVALVFLILWVVRIFNRPDGTAKEVKAELSEIKKGLNAVGEETKAILEYSEVIQSENVRISKLLQQDAAEAERQRQAYEADTRRLRQKIDALRAGFETERTAREEIRNTANKYPPLIAK